MLRLFGVTVEYWPMPEWSPWAISMAILTLHKSNWSDAIITSRTLKLWALWVVGLSLLSPKTLSVSFDFCNPSTHAKVLSIFGIQKGLGHHLWQKVVGKVRGPAGPPRHEPALRVGQPCLMGSVWCSARVIVSSPSHIFIFFLSFFSFLENNGEA